MGRGVRIKFWPSPSFGPLFRFGRSKCATVALVTQLPGPDAARWFGVDAGGATHAGRLEHGGSGVGREAAGQGDAQACLYPIRCSRLRCRSCLPDGSFRVAAICVSTLSRAAPNDLCDGLIWPKDVFASTAWAQQRRHNFLPLPVQSTAIPRAARKFLLCCPAPQRRGVRPQSPPAS